MKINVLIFFIITVTLIACASQVKVTYDFPEAMAAPVKTEFMKVCDKGKILYAINCAQCHNIKRGKKEFIPDFSPEELKGYELRVANRKHEENMPDERVTAEELGLISTFLLYKKKSGFTRKKS